MPRVVFSSGRIWAIAPDAILRHTDPTATTWCDAPALPAPVVAIEVCMDRCTIVAACRDGSLHLLHAESGALSLSAAEPLHATPLCLLPMPAENALFVGLRDGAVVRLHLASLAFDCMLGCGVEHSNAVNTLDADDSYLYSGGEDGVVLVWDLNEATCVREISMPSAAIRSLLRVDVALWVGLADGAVEVFDIFGDDSNGIERIAKNVAHAGPVTEFVKVGETEVWSVAAVPEVEGVPVGDAPSLAVWDTRDMSFNVAETRGVKQAVCATVVERVSFEQVTVLALTEALCPHFISKQVKGSMVAAAEEQGNGYDFFVSDLEDQLVQANAELHVLRAPSTPQVLIKEGQVGSPAQVFEVSSPQAAPIGRHPYESDAWTPEDDAGMRMRVSHSASSAFVDNDGDSFVLARSVSGALLVSLRRISELLVTLLTDDVLSPSEGHTRGSNDDLRAAVATITQELNCGRRLVESCTAATGSENSADTVDENAFGRNMPPTEVINDAQGQLLRKRLNKELTNNRRLQKDLRVVTKERDLLAEDLQQSKVQSESTMTSLEGIIRDNTVKFASSDVMLVELRKECKNLQSRCDNQGRRLVDLEQLSDGRKAKIEELLSTHATVSKAYEEKLATAYDKIETRSIESLSQRDTIRGMEKHVESLKRALQSSEEKRKGLDDALVLITDRVDAQAKLHDSAIVQKEKEHENELKRLHAEHASALNSLGRQHQEALAHQAELLSRCEDGRRADHEALVEMRKELHEVKLSHEEVSESAKKTEQMLKAQAEKDAVEYRKVMRQAQQEKLELEERLLATEASARDEQRRTENAHTETCEERDARLLELEDMVAQWNVISSPASQSPESESSVIADLKATMAQLEEEVDHRISASALQDVEIEKLKSAAINYERATVHLQTELQNAESEIVDLIAKLEGQDRNPDGLGSRPSKDRNPDGLRSRPSSFASCDKTSDDTTGDVQTEEDADSTAELTTVHDSSIAVQALLQSAHGEIEQMSIQLEAMHRVHKEQNRELNELRTALSWRVIRKADENIQKSLQRAGLGNDFVLPTQLGERYSDRDSFDEEDELAVRENAMFARASCAEVGLVNDALQEVQEGMVATQDKLRELSTTARKYREAAQSHLNVLPILYELECELKRISENDDGDGSHLISVRGVVQSIIAQYFSSAEKRAVSHELNDKSYAPSSRRLEALQETVARMRKLRKNIDEGFADSTGMTETGNTSDYDFEGHRVGDQATTPTRLLTF